MNDLMLIEKLAHWEKLKTLVLDSVSSPITKRVYNMALNEFLAWYHPAPRPGFTKATVSAWRVSLEDRKLGSSSIIEELCPRMPFLVTLQCLPGVASSPFARQIAESRGNHGIAICKPVW